MAAVTIVTLVAVLTVQTQITYRQRDRAGHALAMLADTQSTLHSTRSSLTRTQGALDQLKVSNQTLQTASTNLKGQVDGLNGQVDGLNGQVADLTSELHQAQAAAKNAYDRAYQRALTDVKGQLRQREDAVAQREQDVAQRERAVGAIEHAQFGDGTWRVGAEVQAGTYRASGGSDCYWERLSGFSGSFGDLIVNGIGVPHPVVTISASDVGFSSEHCGTWTPVS